jgi:hypothetical protein
VKKYRGIPPYKTTHKYVRAVLWRYYRFRRKRRKPVRPKTKKPRARRTTRSK